MRKEKSELSERRKKFSRFLARESDLKAKGSRSVHSLSLS